MADNLIKGGQKSRYRLRLVESLAVSGMVQLFDLFRPNQRIAQDSISPEL